MTQEYEVEKIMNCGYNAGKLYYHVKWAGYDSVEDMTWEPYNNLENCTELIDQYFRTQNIPKPPDIDPKLEVKLKPKKTDDAKKSQKTEEKDIEIVTPIEKPTSAEAPAISGSTPTIIDEDSFYKGKYAIVRVPKRPVINDGMFCVSDPVDYGPHVKASEINIDRIARKDGKLFVVLNKKNKIEYIPFETAVMLFPDSLYSFMKSKK